MNPNVINTYLKLNEKREKENVYLGDSGGTVVEMERRQWWYGGGGGEWERRRRRKREKERRRRRWNGVSGSKTRKYEKLGDG